MAIERTAKEIQEGVWLSRIKEYFNVRLVIMEVRPGETREASWNRHLADHPKLKGPTSGFEVGDPNRSSFARRLPISFPCHPLKGFLELI